MQLASDRAPSGPLTGEQLAAHRRKLLAEAVIRSGDQPDLSQFSPKEQREIRKNAALTALQGHFSGLPMESALAIWDVATPQEKATLVPELIKKKTAYLRTHSADTMTEKQGGLNGSTQHSARAHIALKTKAKIAPQVKSTGTLPWLGFDQVQSNRSVLPGKHYRINALDGVASTV